MARKDISDLHICAVVFLRSLVRNFSGPTLLELLHESTGQPEKVCLRAIERAAEHNMIEYGHSIAGSWLTEKGYALLRPHLFT